MATTGLDIGSLLAGLQGGGGGEPAGGGMMGQMGGMGEGTPVGSGGGEEDAISILKEMIDLAHRYLQVEPDEEDKATMEQVATMLQKYLAREQADSEKLLGGGALSRTLRRV